jgi:small subunit ribosomal protein S17
METQEQKLKTLTAVVIGNSGKKSIKVAIDYKVRHPKYGKYVSRQTRLAVHDEHNQS